MCGVAGFWQPYQKENKAKNEQYIQKMAEQLIHRGPDGQDEHADPERGLYMAHTRLSIIGLETGQQPLHDKQAGLILTANGEFYDYKRIRGELVIDGFDFMTKSDSEIAMKLYQKHGLDFVQHLRGEFAFALFDKKNETLILVRDRLGVRPLFFHVPDDGNAIFYGSEIKSVFAHPDVPQTMSARSQLHQMMQIMVPGETLFENIHALKPGHMMIVKKGKDGLEIRERQYWDMEFPMEGDHAERSTEEHIQAVRDALTEAIGLRLEADVPVGCFLSGGIDSCSIMGVATAMRQDAIKAFTIGFDDDRYDETDIAREMADECNADHEVLEITADDIYGENYEKAIWHSERTFYNTLGIAKMVMSKHVQDSGYKVMMTGEGADEIFGGYVTFKQDMFIHDPAYDAEAEIRKLKESNKVFSGSVLAEKTASHPALDDVFGFTPSWMQPWILVLEQVRPLLSKEFLEEIGDYDPLEAIAKSFDKEKIEGRHPLDKVQYSWAKTMLEGQILNWAGERVDMAHAIETRPPFLDHHLVETAINLPPHVRIRNGTEKWVLREAMKNVLPEVLYKREKFAFMAPPAHTDKKKTAQMEELIEKHLSEERIAQVGMLDRQAFAAFLDDYRSASTHARKTQQGIILNHLVAIHAMDSMFCTTPANAEMGAAA